MLMSKYVRKVGSSTSRPYGKRSRSPAEFSRHVRPAVAKTPPLRGTFDKSRLGPTNQLKEYPPSSEKGKMWRVKPQGAKAGEPKNMTSWTFGGLLAICSQILR